MEQEAKLTLRSSVLFDEIIQSLAVVLECSFHWEVQLLAYDLSMARYVPFLEVFKDLRSAKL